LTVTLETPPPKGYTAYVTAKSGLRGLTRCVAAEYGRFGITANMVSPGLVETDLTAHLDERAKKMTAARIPAGRIAVPADVVGPALFLLSPAAQYINGATLSVNGGLQF
jgi:NAD(P)-dependent dehydrogenase (short-subunit alcohol dehydrogenase family)